MLGVRAVIRLGFPPVQCENATVTMIRAGRGDVLTAQTVQIGFTTPGSNASN